MHGASTNTSNVLKQEKHCDKTWLRQILLKVTTYSISIWTPWPCLNDSGYVAYKRPTSQYVPGIGWLCYNDLLLEPKISRTPHAADYETAISILNLQCQLPKLKTHAYCQGRSALSILSECGVSSAIHDKVRALDLSSCSKRSGKRSSTWSSWSAKDSTCTLLRVQCIHARHVPSYTFPHM